MPIVPLGDPVDALAHDSQADEVYGLSQGELVRIDLETGESDVWVTHDDGLGTSLTYDAERDRLYAASASALYSVDPVERTVSQLASQGAIALAYEPDQDRLLCLQSIDASLPSLRRLQLDLSTGLTDDLGPVGLHAAPSAIALASDPSSEAAVLLAGFEQSATDAFARHCREAAYAMGVDATSSVPIGEYGDAVSSGDSRTLDYAEGNPPLLLYGSPGDASEDVATLRIATEHPDAVICISAGEQPLDVVVEEAAQLRLLVLSTEAVDTTVTVQSGFSPNPFSPLPIRTHSEDEAGPTVEGADELHVHYDADAWRDLGLEVFSATTSPRVLPWLGPLDYDSGAVALRPLDTRSHELIGALTPYPSP
jgi:hypothetical protein